MDLVQHAVEIMSSFYTYTIDYSGAVKILEVLIKFHPKTAVSMFSFTVPVN